jgi:hypothetical protein
MTETKKRIGRPMKEHPKRVKRVSLGLKVRVDIKRLIDKAAHASGRTQSQEAEALIEKALSYDRMLDAMHTTVQAIAEGNVEAAAHKGGYVTIRTIDGKKSFTFEPDPAKRSGFVADKPDEELKSAG